MDDDVGWLARRGHDRDHAWRLDVVVTFRIALTDRDRLHVRAAGDVLKDARIVKHIPRELEKILDPLSDTLILFISDVECFADVRCPSNARLL
jgi:hypothetical protein